MPLVCDRSIVSPVRAAMKRMSVYDLETETDLSSLRVFYQQKLIVDVISQASSGAAKAATRAASSRAGYSSTPRSRYPVRERLGDGSRPIVSSTIGASGSSRRSGGGSPSIAVAVPVLTALDTDDVGAGAQRAATPHLRAQRQATAQLLAGTTVANSTFEVIEGDVELANRLWRDHRQRMLHRFQFIVRESRLSTA